MLTSRDGGDGDGILKKSADVQTRTSIHKEQQDTFGDFDQQNTKKTQVVSSKDAFFLLEQVFVKSQIFRLGFCWEKNDSQTTIHRWGQL